MQSLIDILKSWSDNNDNRLKLQQAYLATALILLLAAGMVGLVNYQFGQQILLLALIAGAIFIINAVAWALLQSFILLHLDNAHTTRVAPEATDEPEELIASTVEEEPVVKSKKVKTTPSKTSKKTQASK